VTQEEVELVWMCGYSGHDDTSRVDATADETKATCNSGHVTDQKNLDRALTIVKAAGYRVSKPKTPKRKNCIGPTFVAEFADGAITRMSTFTSLEKLDWGRGERLSQAVINHGGGHANAPIISNKPVSPAWSRRGGVDRARGS